MSEENKKKNFGLSAVFGAATGFTAMPNALVLGGASLLAAGHAGAGENLVIATGITVGIAVGAATKEAGRHIAKKFNQNHSASGFQAGLLAGAFGFLMALPSILEHFDLVSDYKTEAESMVIEQSLDF